ncbi:MAG: FAD-binding protein [Bacteroidia bacterium]|nr:FAD-binding protein [Bacteroidia bacterium]
MPTVKTLSGGEASIDDAMVQALSESLQGDVVTPASSSYDEVREIWNAMIDRRPGIIVRCASAEDVVRAVNLARENDLLVTVRGAGHNIAGKAIADGALMIDLSGMKSVTVDAANKTVRAEPGVTLGELDAATQEHGLAVSAGINSTTGVAGLTLGGGFGWLSRTYGMTIDNLISADVVTANGDLVKASADSNPDLFWAIRGGGGNFGVVTSFEYQAQSVGPEILSGLIVHPASEARACLDFYRDFAAQAPDELTTWVVMRKAPPLPFLPEEVHGTDILIFAVMYSGDMESGERAVQALRDFGSPIADAIGPHPFVGWQAAFDPLLTPGLRNYWKSHNFPGLSDELLDMLVASAGNLPSPHTEIFIAQMGGAQSRVDPGATAYWHRDAAFVMNVHTRWEEAGDDDQCVAWARQLFNDAAPHATGGVYVNFMPDDEADRVGEAYGGNYERLVDLKTEYDPTNMFRVNHNIQPR